MLVQCKLLAEAQFFKALAQNEADWVGDGLQDGIKVWNTCGGK